MKYIVDVAGERVTVDLADGATVDGDTLPTHLAQVPGTPVHIATIGTRQYGVVARREGPRGSYAIWLDGWRFAAVALDERTRAIRDLGAAQAAASGPAPVVAPMPGLVVKVHVKVGDQVQAGQPVVVMEAMKMENELKAGSAGVVKAIHAVPGKATEKGAVLVEFV